MMCYECSTVVICVVECVLNVWMRCVVVDRGVGVVYVWVGGCVGPLLRYNKHVRPFSSALQVSARILALAAPP